MIDIDEVRAATAEIVAENPDATNPRDHAGSCLYVRQYDDTSTSAATNCLAGAVALKFGCTLPREHLPIEASDSIMFTFSKGAINYLRIVQYSADNYNWVSGAPERTWAEALDIVNERYDHFLDTGKLL